MALIHFTDDLLVVSKPTMKTRGQGGGVSKEEQEEEERKSDADEEEKEDEGEGVQSNEGEDKKVPAGEKRVLPTRSVKGRNGAEKKGSVGKKGFPPRHAERSSDRLKEKTGEDTSEVVGGRGARRKRSVKK